MNPTKYDLSAVRREDVHRYTPGERLIVYEWFCEHCDERIGYPYMPDTHATVCDDPAECPHSVEWDGDACGHVVCEWCHEPAVDQQVKWTDEDAVEALADTIGLEDSVSPF